MVIDKKRGKNDRVEHSRADYSVNSMQVRRLKNRKNGTSIAYGARMESLSGPSRFQVRRPSCEYKVEPTTCHDVITFMLTHIYARADERKG